jgi:hypothetical protein
MLNPLTDAFASMILTGIVLFLLYYAAEAVYTALFGGDDELE